MNNPNTEGTAPMPPPPLATYPLRSGMAKTHPLTAARVGHPPLPRGPPALLRLPSGPAQGRRVPDLLTSQAQRRPPLRVDASRVSSVGGGAGARARLLGTALWRGRRAAGRGACPW
eukprot:scaffold23491_cov66-Phaeocystis_antarctica.AAC.11